MEFIFFNVLYADAKPIPLLCNITNKIVRIFDSKTSNALSELVAVTGQPGFVQFLMGASRLVTQVDTNVVLFFLVFNKDRIVIFVSTCVIKRKAPNTICLLKVFYSVHSTVDLKVPIYPHRKISLNKRPTCL